MKNAFLFLLSLQLLSFWAGAQPQALKFKRYFTSNGLSSNIVLGICKDQKGFMWFATRNGLNKFDGYQFTNYKNDLNNPRSLRHNMVRSVYEDRQRNLWVGTFDGHLHLYNQATDNFTAYVSGNKEVSVIYEDSRHRLWVGTYGGGLHLFDRNQKIFTSFLHDARNPQSISGNFVRTITEDKQGFLWVGDGKSGLNRLEKDGKSFTRFYATSGGLIANDIYALYVDETDHLWIGTEFHGLSVLNPARTQYQNYTHDPKNTNSLTSSGIKGIIKGPDGHIWIGTNNGLSILDRQTGTFNNTNLDLNNPQGLSHHSLEFLYADPAGPVWLGTWNGLNMYYKSHFIHYRHDYRDPSSMMKNRVSDFLEDSEGNIWITLDPGGLELFDRKNNHFTHFTHQPGQKNGLSGSIGLTVEEDKEGNLLIGTSDGGFNVYNKKSRQFTSYQKNPDDTTSISSQAVSVVCQDHLGYLWLGTWNNGLNRFDRQTGKAIRLVNRPSDATSLNSNVVKTMLEDSQHNLWVGTLLGGLELLDREKGKATHHIHDPKDSLCISSNNVNALFEDRQRRLWIGTDDGLNLYNYENKTFSAFREKDGLLSGSIRSILEDDHGNLWLGTGRGLSRFDPVTRTFKNYSDDIGLQGDDFMNNACMKVKSGEMYFGGTNGFNIFHPDSIRDNAFVPPVYLTSLQVFNKPISIGSPDSLLPKALDETDVLTLSYEHSVFSFQFAALNYIVPERNQYAYRMEGFDKDWHHVGNQRSATYTNLDPGEYIFRVKAANNDGLWNEEGARVKIVITPPWWKTTWFRSGALLLVVLMAATGYQLKTSSIRRHNRELEARIRERTREIEQQKHEIETQRDNLNQINEVLERKVDERTQELQAANEELQASFEDQSRSLREKEVLLAEVHHRVKNNLAVISGLLQMQIFSTPNPELHGILQESQRRIKSMALIHEKLYQHESLASIDFADYIRDLVLEIQQTYPGQAQAIEVHSHLESVLLELTVAIPCGLLLNEILSNAYKHAFVGRTQGRIDIRFFQEYQQLVLEVRDDGIGLKPDLDLQNLSSLGMKLIQTLTKQLKGQLMMKQEGGLIISVRFEPVKMKTWC